MHVGSISSVHCSAVGKMSDLSWLQPAPGRRLVDAGAAAAAQAASDLLMQYGGNQKKKKKKKQPSAVSAQKTAKAKSSEVSGAGKAQHIAEEHIHIVLPSVDFGDNPGSMFIMLRGNKT